MGGGNGQKSAQARERNAAKKMKDAKMKQREANKGKITADREGLKCKICMTTFMVTANHSTNKRTAIASFRDHPDNRSSNVRATFSSFSFSPTQPRSHLLYLRATSDDISSHTHSIQKDLIRHQAARRHEAKRFRRDTMGGGNGQKSKEARERNMAKKMKDQKQKNHAENKGKMAADKESIKCKICMTTFMVTANAKMLNDHFQSKHSTKGFTIEQCFPGVSTMA